MFSTFEYAYCIVCNCNDELRLRLQLAVLETHILRLTALPEKH
jgi:hypothetical protein